MTASRIPDEIRENMLKLRKGAAGWLNAKKLEDIFQHLDSGWKIERAPMWRASDNERSFPQRYAPRSDWEIRIQSAFNRKGGALLEARGFDREELEQYHELLRQIVREDFPGADRKWQYKDAITMVGPIQERKGPSSSLPTYHFPIELLMKVRGTLVTSPDGKEYQVAASRALGLGGSNSFADWFEWAKENTSFMHEILGALGMAPHIPRAAQPREAKHGQMIGCCAICDREQVVKGGRMVLHGYQRPGIGMIVGDCFGTGRDAYEVSPRACVDYIPKLQEGRKSKQDFLARLQADKITVLYRTDFRRKELVPVRREDPEFPRLRKQAIELTTREISVFDTMIGEMERKIRDWKPGELRGGEAAEIQVQDPEEEPSSSFSP